MRALRTKKSSLSEIEMNLTPLIDICFVVLIMFIVVAPLLEVERIDLASGPPLDEKSLMAVDQKSPISIHVHSDNSLFFNQQPLPISQLKRALTDAKTRLPKARPQIFHDKKASFGTYQAIKNAVESAGFTEMDLILKPD